MNLITVIILAAIVVNLAITVYGDHLNLKALRPAPPQEFAALYDARRYRRAQEYLRANTVFGWFSGAFDLMVLLAFWFGGGFVALDGWVRSPARGELFTGMLFIGALLGFKLFLGIPFSLYATFVIEEKFGFNRMTVPTFFADLAKKFILTVLLGGPLLAGILFFFQAAGTDAWWISWLVVTGFMLLLQYVAPTWILPLFNRYTPLEEGELRDAIFQYARSIRFPLENVFLMDGSRRSSKSNAFFTGFGRHRRIVLFDTLVEQLSSAELVGVLAHEMGHYTKKHIFKMMFLGVIQMGVLFFLLSLFISSEMLSEAFFMPQPRLYAGIVFFMILYAPIDLVVSLLVQAVSRRHEFEADRFAAETTGQSSAMADALRKLSASNLSNLTPHPLYVFLHYSHPPVLERVRALALTGSRT